jgi:hypothetical protein
MRGGEAVGEIDGTGPGRAVGSSSLQFKVRGALVVGFLRF